MTGQTIFDMSDPEYLRDLAERIFRVPAEHGVSQADYDRLGQAIASHDAMLTTLGDFHGEVFRFGDEAKKAGDLRVKIIAAYIHDRFYVFRGKITGNKPDHQLAPRPKFRQSEP